MITLDRWIERYAAQALSQGWVLFAANTTGIVVDPPDAPHHTSSMIREDDIFAAQKAFRGALARGDIAP
jgi:hypothetical protein